MCTWTAGTPDGNETEYTMRYQAIIYLVQGGVWGRGTPRKTVQAAAREGANLAKQCQQQCAPCYYEIEAI